MTEPSGSSRRSHAAMLRLVDRLTTGYWFVPLALILGSVGAAIGLVVLDRNLDEHGIRWTYVGGAQNASDTLTTIASSMITFTGVVFSITVVALQLTSSQFSPRVLRNFLRDRVSQLALGVFVGTFAYSFVALAAIRYSTNATVQFVPSITVTGCYVLIAASVVLFVRLIHHTADSLRAVTIIERVAEETRHAIERQFPSDAAHAQAPDFSAEAGVVVRSRRSGVITDVDLERMAKVANESHAFLRVCEEVGAYVCTGQPLVRVYGTDAVDDRRVLREIHFAKERSTRDDAAFGIRQLVDIAERALSPGVNDPTTAVQCIDRIHDLLRRLTNRDLPRNRVATIDGVPRAWVPLPSYRDFVSLGASEILENAQSSPRVQARIRAMFTDLVALAVIPEHQMVLVDEERRLLTPV
jgi:uncharacterized membrane protein